MGCKKAPENWPCTRAEGHDGPCASEYVGPERRAMPPATRRFVTIMFLLAVAYVSLVFWYSSSRTSDNDLREAIRTITLNSCNEGNKLRAEVGRPDQNCAERVAKLPR